MNYLLYFLLLLAVASCGRVAGMVGSAEQEGKLVHNITEFKEAVKAAQPGDRIVLANGTWKDAELVFEGKGTAAQPILLTVQEKGKVILEGKSNLSLAGEHLVVSGLVFKNGYTPTGEVIAFRKDKENLANNCRVTECVIDNYNNPERFDSDLWVSLFGKNNRFDHNHLEGKRNQGVTLAVRMDTEESRESDHRIDHNYFGPRPTLGSNGGETIRIGTSHYSLSNSNTIVENNYFDRCNGEVEIISSKSGGNIYRNNVFFECRGTLTLRHGNGNVVEGNVFIGNGVPHTGGIRVINANQKVENNYLSGLTGYRFGGALVVMNGVPNSTINRYHQVNNASITNNTLIDCDHIQLAAGSDQERSAVPVNSLMANNLIYNQDGKDIITVFDDISGIRFKDNAVHQVSNPELKTGFAPKTIRLQRNHAGLLVPQNTDLAGTGIRKDLKPVAKEATGVSWYPKSDPEVRFATGATMAVKPGLNTLAEAVAKAQKGDVLELEPGEYTLTKILEISEPLTIRSRKGEEKKPVLTFEKTALFEIKDGGSLSLYGLSVSGKKAPDNAGNSIIRTSRYSMLRNYKLFVDACDFRDFDVNHSFNFLTVAKHTMADTILIRDTRVQQLTGDLLALDKETDNLGIYNADYVLLENSIFNGIGGVAVNLYRGGTDESTFGPHLHVKNCVFRNVGHDKRNKTGASMQLLGVQVTDIQSNEFISSAPVLVTHTVGEPITRIVSNNFWKTPKPKASDNTAQIEQNVEKEPAFVTSNQGAN